ncbi:MAG TPA: hypothetical protein VJI15_03125 [Candidatus Nanoarchaeia archaeon]|nr:hypothetical protein [Candidatus Nanoarchaeia archaeon]
MSLKQIYEQHYKKLLIIPFLMVVLAIGQIAFQYASTGDIVHKGISLKGGSTITIEGSLDAQQVQSYLQEQFPTGDISVRALSAAGKNIGVSIDADAQLKEETDVLLAALRSKGFLTADTKYSLEVVGSSLGESFFRQIATALLLAFLLMAIVVFIYFRIPIPCLAVILAAFSDIIVTLAIFNLTGMKLNSGGIAAFLMLVGFSVDTDMLLTARVLKRVELPFMERVYGAVTTGLTMTMTTLAVIIVALIFSKSDVVQQIMLILGIGLVVDMAMTWIQNVGLLRLYFERKHQGKKGMEH